MYTASAVKKVEIIDISVGCMGGNPLPTINAATMEHHSHSPSASFLDFMISAVDCRMLPSSIFMPLMYCWLLSIYFYQCFMVSQGFMDQ